MNELLLVVVEFAPGPAGLPVRCSETAVGLARHEGNDFEDVWIATDGTGTVAAPRRSTAIDQPSHEPVLADVHGWRVELRYQPSFALALTRGGERRVIALPPAVAEDVQAIDKGRPSLFWAPDADVVGICGKHRVSWVKASRLQAKGDRIYWRVRRCLPTGDLSARDAAEVTLSAYGRTHLEVGGRVVTAGPTELTKGERVTLVERLVDAYGILAYGAVVREDGSRLALPNPIGPEPGDAFSDVRYESTDDAPPPLTLDPRTRAAVDALRGEGLLQELTPERLDRLFPASARGRGSPDLFTLLERHYADRGPALADQASSHEDQAIDTRTVQWLCELVGQPLLRCTRARPDHLELEAASGGEIDDVYFDDLPLFTLAARFDDQLAAVGDERRFHHLSSGSDARNILLLLATDRAKRLVTAGIPIQKCGWAEEG